MTHEGPTAGPPALRGLTVLDFSDSLVGCQATQVLADFGARVVHVEPPGGGRVRRNPAYRSWARGKESVVLDLKTESGQATALALASTADVAITTFMPGTADRLGIGYGRLSGVNPALVYGSVTGFGADGPYAHLRGHEPIVMAKIGGLHGLAGMTSREGPAYGAVPHCSFTAAQLLLTGVLAGLYERFDSGRGQHVETTLVQALAAHDIWSGVGEAVAKNWPGAYAPAPAIHNGIPLTDIILRVLIGASKDGSWLQFSQTAPHLFRALINELGLGWIYDDPEWRSAPVFDDDARRVRLWEWMLEGVATKTAEDWRAVFDREPNVWGEAFAAGSEVLDNVQLNHDGQVVVIDDPEVGPVRQLGSIFHLVQHPADLTRPAPGLDSHGAEIRADLAARSPGPSADAGVDAGAADRRPALAGVTIVEFAGMFAAPYSTSILADLGARVIKVEPPDGDQIRRLVGIPEVSGTKANQGKESIALDLTTEQGVAIARRLASTATIVVQGYRGGVAKRLGIDAESVRLLNPDVVYLSATGYGEDGPCAHRPAYAPALAAAAGTVGRNIGAASLTAHGLSLEGVKERALQFFVAGGGVAQPDGFSAVSRAAAQVLGLVALRLGNGANDIHSTMLGVTAHANSEVVLDHQDLRAAPEPDDQLLGLGALYRLYRSADGWLFLAVASQRELDRFRAHLGATSDVALGGGAEVDGVVRVDDEAGVAESLQALFGTRPGLEWESELSAAGVGCAVVEETLPEELLFRVGLGHRLDLITHVEHPLFGTHERLRSLMSFSRSETWERPAPLAGMDSSRILDELGFTSSEIEQLRADGVVFG